MEQIFIKAFKEKDNKLYIDVETYIILNIYKICGNFEIKLLIELLKEQPDININVEFNEIPYTVAENEVPNYAYYCTWPVIVKDNYVIAGLCSVSREIIKSSENKLNLLGFREACLISCSETSIWTRFCEVDILFTTKKLLKNISNYLIDDTLHIPEDLLRFEYHMEQPIRIHNVYKFARKIKNNKDISSKVPISELGLDHTYSEGPFMTLADVILYCYYHIIFSVFSKDLLKEKLPLTLSWYNRMDNKITITHINIERRENFRKVLEPIIEKQSLYTADPNRYRPERRAFTKQNDIENSLNIIKEINVINNIIPYGEDIEFNWIQIPNELNPMGGALPEKRAKRKCEQLQNLVKAIIKLVGNEQWKIVDYCSGSGHLGLLLAYLLPKCQIILIDNKEQSLYRAKIRIKSQNLINVVILQSNLDYFIGKFDVGVSLHACGVATDLVIENCIKNRANFVCCPCCYGATRDCYHIKYPRSKEFNNVINVKDYLILAHAADQTHEIDNNKTSQGYVCMDIIDTDRKLYAESYGYSVYLGKLIPISCTNKNNLIVGIYNKTF